MRVKIIIVTVALFGIEFGIFIIGNLIKFEPLISNNRNSDSMLDTSFDIWGKFIPAMLSPKDQQQRSALDISKLQYHGTTTIAFKNGDSVIVCVDSKASIGKYMGSRTVKKVFPISRYIVATMAGGAGDCAYWIKNMATFVKLFEHEYGMQAMKVESIAKVLANKLAEFKGAELSVGTMIAGYDISTRRPSYSEGSYVSGDLFCVGSGSTLAYSILDSVGEHEESRESNGNNNVDKYKSKDAVTNVLRSLPLHEAVDIAVAAVQAAAQRDGYSGGYINVLVLNETGCHHIRRLQANRQQQQQQAKLVNQ